jgi:hypothetical protein
VYPCHGTGRRFFLEVTTSALEFTTSALEFTTSVPYLVEQSQLRCVQTNPEAQDAERVRMIISSMVVPKSDTFFSETPDREEESEKEDDEGEGDKNS